MTIETADITIWWSTITKTLTFPLHDFPLCPLSHYIKITETGGHCTPLTLQLLHQCDQLFFTLFVLLQWSSRRRISYYNKEPKLHWTPCQCDNTDVLPCKCIKVMCNGLKLSVTDTTVTKWNKIKIINIVERLARVSQSEIRELKRWTYHHYFLLPLLLHSFNPWMHKVAKMVT